MDIEQLRALQAPLKRRYADDPEAARTVVAASATFADPGMTATVETWAGPVRAGLHPATGGDGADACSADMLLQALIGCLGVTLRSVATAMRLEIRSASITARGVFDARGTLGLSRHVPVGVTDIEILGTLDTEATDEQLQRLAALSERYCVVAQSLDPRPTIRMVRAGGGGRRA